MPLRLSAFIGRVIVGNKNTSPRVIVFELSLINSSAFRDLNRAALIVLLGFYGKRRMVKQPHRSKREPTWVIENNGEITYTYKEAERQGISSPAFTRAIDHLIAHGFIEVAQTGAGLYKTQTLYKILEKWRDWGTENFTTKPRVPRARYNSHGFQKGHPYHPSKRSG
jgi:hypothetical protein